MADLRFNKQYCIVKDKDETVISEFFPSARVETPHQMTRYDDIKTIPLKDIPDLPEIGEAVEKNRLYKVDAKVVQCVTTHNREEYTTEKKQTLFTDEKPIIDIYIKPKSKP